MNPADFLEKTYDECMSVIGQHNAIMVKLSSDEKELIDEILRHSESARGVLTVVITSIVSLLSG